MILSLLMAMAPSFDTLTSSACNYFFEKDI